jgi:TPR repeat protein
LKANRLVFTVLLLFTAVFQLRAEQTEINRKQVEELKAKAEAGDAESEYRLGLCYFRGRGVTKDEAVAFRWSRKAAEQNYAPAQNNLGAAYATGRGVVKDNAAAFKLYRKAAEQNYAVAQCNLGLCYATGEGMTKDYVKAYTWFLLAAGQGYEPAKQNLTLLEKKMTAEQIAEGQKAGARNFKRWEVPLTGER